MKELAQYCNFGSALDENIRDRLVCGIQDPSLGRSLLEDKGLTLNNAVERAIAAEMAKNKLPQIHATSSEVKPVLAVKDSKPSVSGNTATNYSNINCFGCGGNHLRKVCKFRTAECHKCHKKEHIARVCRGNGQGNFRTMSTHAVQVEKHVNIADLTICHVNMEENEKDCIQATIFINGRPCQMEIDSESRVTLDSLKTLQQLYTNKLPEIVPSQLILKDYNKNIVATVGKCTVEWSYS